MTSSETEVAVLFADVVGSTRLYELFGDNRARELILVCIDLAASMHDALLDASHFAVNILSADQEPIPILSR